jgi:hypothetical protein
LVASFISRLSTLFIITSFKHCSGRSGRKDVQLAGEKPAVDVKFKRRKIQDDKTTQLKYKHTYC